jgi:hypothetical protein
MNERDNELFEAELRRLKPARLPEQLQSRLESLPPLAPQRTEARNHPTKAELGWWSWLRWLAPAMAVGVALLVVVSHLDRDRKTAAPTAAESVPSLKADQVEIDRELLSSFDAVADVADGEPVRFRCQQWMDAVTLRDSARGVEVVQRIPRIEVVPVSFATY